MKSSEANACNSRDPARTVGGYKICLKCGALKVSHWRPSKQ